MAVTIGSVVFIAIGLAFLAGGSLLYSKKKRQKSTSARLEEIIADYSKQMDAFRKKRAFFAIVALGAWFAWLEVVA